MHTVKRPETKKCLRCGMLFNEYDIRCPYCIGKSNAEIIRDVHLVKSQQQRRTAKIGYWFITIVVVLLIMLIGYTAWT